MAYTRFGDPSAVLRWTELPEPKVGPESVLIRIQAAGVNPVDWQTMAGHLNGRFDTLFPVIPGWDVAGEVLEVGTNVSRFSPGDAVFGYLRTDLVHHGSYAERTVAPERVLAHRPPELDVIRAAALPVIGLTAWQAIHQVLQIRAGETVLIQAAAGSVGRIAAQFAIRVGATVLGTASAHHANTLQNLGVIPIPREGDLHQAVCAFAPHGVDAVLDMYGGPSLALYAALLQPERPTRIVSLTNDGVRGLGGRFLFAQPNPTQLDRLAKLVLANKLVLPPLNQTPLEDTARLLTELSAGRATGKQVLVPQLTQPGP